MNALQGKGLTIAHFVCYNGLAAQVTYQQKDALSESLGRCVFSFIDNHMGKDIGYGREPEEN